MLHFSYMNSLKYGSGMSDRVVGSFRCRPELSRLAIKRLSLLPLIFLLTATLFVQTHAAAQDCSDPLMSNSQACSGLSQQDLSQLPGAQTNPNLAGSAETQIGNSTSNNLSGSRVGQAGALSYSDASRQSRGNSTQNLAQQTQLLPEPLTEFQKFVASTSGQILPIFGADLFRRVPSTFAPLDMTPVPLDYIVGPDDELRIRVWGQVGFQSNLRVDRAGEIFLPQVGQVHVAGLKFSELDGHLRSAIGRVYRNFDLTVDVGEIRSIQVYLSGQARRPGLYTVSSLSTLVDALFAAGGPSVEGSLRHIQLRRGSEVVADFDLYNLLIRGDKSKDAKLQNGDVIFIPPAGPQVAITGSVRNPAIFELREHDTLAALLANAGGVTSVASEARISIERIADHSDRHAMEVAYDEAGLATETADGDLVRVYSIAPKYAKTVILRGNIANPGRFAWHAGMRVSDLIPDKESLVTRNYWWKRAQLGLPAPEFEPLPGLDTLRQPADGHPASLERTLQESRNAAIRLANQEALAYSQGLNGNQQWQNGNRQGQPVGQQPQSENRQHLNEQGLAADQQGMPGDQQDPYGYYSNQNVSADQREGSASLGATVNSPAGSGTNRIQRTEVRALAPEIDWDYAVIERIDPETLKSVLIPFDLGRLVLQHDGSQNLELQASDVVSIFSGADIRLPLAHQTKFVRLDGEVAHAGVYTVAPGETLRKLVERAGGITPNAYLYGSEFTRESARIVQQARIDEYIQSLSLRIQRSNLASGAASSASEPDLLTTLRKIRATGRVVLRFTPESASTSTLPDLALEDGDRFVIPPVPATVNVVGAVYDQNSFLYSRERIAGTYLRLAGGANRDADRRREFIIRADGEVESRARSKSLWSGDEFNNLHINPGDTIVVPDKTFKPSTLNNVLSQAGVFANFAVDAALLSSIY